MLRHKLSKVVFLASGVSFSIIRLAKAFYASVNAYEKSTNFIECSKRVSYKGFITGVNDGGITKGEFRSVFPVNIIAIVITRREGGGFWNLATPLYRLRINLVFSLDLVSCFNFSIFISFYNRMSF